MPPSRTARQTLSSFSSRSSSSFSESSIVRDLPHYRQQQRIPNLTIYEFGRVLEDNDQYDRMMATIFHHPDLFSRTITMWHLWFTMRQLRDEARCQFDEAIWVFKEMEMMDLHEELYSGMARSESWSPIPATRPPTPYYPAPHSSDQDISQSPTPPTTSLDQLIPPLGTPGNPIVISDKEDEVEFIPSYCEAQSAFSTPNRVLLHCKDCSQQRHRYFECFQYICDHCHRCAPMHRVSDCPYRWCRWLQS